MKEPVFVIKASDFSSVAALSTYAEILHNHSVSPEIIRSINEHILLMAEWQRNNQSLVSHPGAYNSNGIEDALLELERVKELAKDLAKDLEQLENRNDELKRWNEELREENIILGSFKRVVADFFRTTTEENKTQIKLEL
jgi:hypothetical protein